MKKQLLFLALLAFVSVASFGQTIMYEPFNYAQSPVQPSATTDSNTPNLANQLIGKTLTGVGTWVAASSTSTTIGDWIVGDSFGYPGMPNSTGNAFYYKGSASKPLLPWSTAISTGKVYYSILIKVDGWYTGGSGQLPDAYGKQMFALAGNVPIPASGNPTVGYLGAFCVKGTPTNPATGFYVGLSNSHVSSTSVVGTNVVWSPTLFTFGVDHLVVVSYDIETGKSNLYLDPTITANSIEPAVPFLTLTDGNTSNTVGGFYIRQDSNGATPYTQLDEIRVARTWREALGQAALSVAQNKISGLKVYPNPVSNGVVYINSSNSDSKSVVVYDVLGKQLMQKVVSNGTLDVSSLNKGVYLMKISEGAATSTQKLVIE